jgi:hypothetical protein
VVDILPGRYSEASNRTSPLSIAFNVLIVLVKRGRTSRWLARLLLSTFFTSRQHLRPLPSAHCAYSPQLLSPSGMGTVMVPVDPPPAPESKDLIGRTTEKFV